MRARFSVVAVLASAMVLAGIAMVSGATLIYLSQRTQPTSAAKPTLADAAALAPASAVIEPDLAWQLDRLNGATTELADFSEKVLFVNNWATWCAPCVREMPAIERLAKRFEGRSVAFIAVSNEPVDKVFPFVQEQNWQLPIYTTKVRPAPFQTDAIPSTFILDGTRRIVLRHMGMADWDDGATDEYLHELLAASS